VIEIGYSVRSNHRTDTHSDSQAVKLNPGRELEEGPSPARFIDDKGDPRY
jgi:hypothetical protein